VAQIQNPDGKKGFKWLDQAGNQIYNARIKQGAYSPTLCIGTEDDSLIAHDVVFTL